MRRVVPLATAALLSLPAAAMAQGLPQLDFKNPLTIDQVGWGAVIFVILFLLCWLWGLPKVASVLDMRAGAISADLDAARSVKEQSDKAAGEMTQAITHARAEAQAAITAATDKAKRENAERSAILDARIEARLAESEQRIGAARRSAMDALRSVATDAANALVGRLTASRPDGARIDRAVGAALDARGQS